MQDHNALIDAWYAAASTAYKHFCVAYQKNDRNATRRFRYWCDKAEAIKQSAPKALRVHMDVETML